ncbi:MAG: hypothetical protein ACKVOJ_10490 [Sphingomonadaceae bacterium]
MRFTRFAVIDWSGAKGSLHPGIALALCAAGDAAPSLIMPSTRHWSRSSIAEWVRAQSGDILIGFDFSFAPPFIARSSYLPGDDVPTHAKPFWTYVDAVCDDDDLGAASFLETKHRRHFYFGAADGKKADFMHNRVCEARYNASGGGKASTVYDVIGAAQVAKASFAGMRLLNAVNPTHPVWPFDLAPASGPLIVEIYTSIAARAAGLRKGRSKIRDPIALDQALAALGTASHTPLAHYNDHATDVILTAAWLRKNAADAALWEPALLTDEIAATEGWTFGIS